MKNIFLNIFKSNYLFIFIKKIIKKFEKNTSVEARNWAKLNTKYITEEFYNLIDPQLYKKILSDVISIEKEVMNKLSKLSISLGGGGNYILLYFLIRKLKPAIVIGTGFAAGWSSLVIPRAFVKNCKGKLYSSDLLYFRLENPKQYIGYLAKNETNKMDWNLDIRGDDLAIPEIVER